MILTDDKSYSVINIHIIVWIKPSPQHSLYFEYTIMPSLQCVKFVWNDIPCSFVLKVFRSIVCSCTLPESLGHMGFCYLSSASFGILYPEPYKIQWKKQFIERLNWRGRGGIMENDIIEWKWRNPQLGVWYASSYDLKNV